MEYYILFYNALGVFAEWIFAIECKGILFFLPTYSFDKLFGRIKMDASVLGLREHRKN